MTHRKSLVTTAFVALLTSTPACSRSPVARTTQSDGGTTPTVVKVEEATRSPVSEQAGDVGPATLAKLGAGVHKQTVTLRGGQQLRYTISVPANAGDGGKTALVVSLHYGGKVTPFYGGDMLDELVGPALRNLGAVLVAPDSLGGDWSAPDNEQAVVWLTQTVRDVYAIDSKRVALTGYSMGAAGTWFLAGRHADLFSAALPVSGPAGDSRVAALRMPLYVIHSAHDEIFPIARTKTFVLDLQAKGANVQWQELRDPTHYQVADFVPALAKAEPWLRAIWDPPHPGRPAIEAQ